MTTRCMNQAVYFCTGEMEPELYTHYGLAMERYTHFTSPIRRYADILVHRLLMASLDMCPLPSSLQAKQAIVEEWEFDEDKQVARHKAGALQDITVFGRIEVLIKADNSDFRNRTRVTFQRAVSPEEVEDDAEDE